MHSNQQLLNKLPERIRNRVHIEPDGCWHYDGYINDDGYVNIKFKGKTRLGHRLIRFLTRNDIPLDMTNDTVLDHGPFCGDRACVCPFHNVPVTHKQNSQVLTREFRENNLA